MAQPKNSPASAESVTDADAAADTNPEYADPAAFENFDNVDGTTVTLPDDSYDPASVNEGECGC